jgi:branched-chain amino acid transport system substrate-binding protein
MRMAGSVAVLALAAVAAGCGSSSGSSGAAQSGSSHSATSSAASTTTATSPAGGSGSGGAGRTAVTDYLRYTHGKAGKADSSLPPVTIGWINQQGGQQQIGPLATSGAEMAVKYINDKLGGVDGHPVRLKTCFIRSAEEEGTTCAQKMLADRSVNVIDEGAVAIGIQSFYSTLDGAKPVIVGVSIVPVDTVQKNAVILFGDATHVLGPLGTYGAKVLHAKKAAVVYANQAGVQTGAEATVKALEKEGVTVKQVAYDESNPDVIGPLTSAGATGADMVIPYTDAAGCANMAKALKQVDITDPKKIVSNPLCLNGQVKKALGGDYPHWTYSIASSLFGDATDPGMQPYEKVAATYSTPADAPDPWNIVAFSQILTTTRFLNELGYGHATPQAVERKAKAFTGPVALGAPSLACGKYAKAPAVCNDRTQFFTYEGNGRFVKAAGWLQPPA